MGGWGQARVARVARIQREVATAAPCHPTPPPLHLQCRGWTRVNIRQISELKLTLPQSVDPSPLRDTGHYRKLLWLVRCGQRIVVFERAQTKWDVMVT